MVDRDLNVSRLNVLEPLPPLSGDDLIRAREEALNQLITRQLILQAERDTVQREIDQLYQQVRQNSLCVDEEFILRELAEMRNTLDNGRKNRSRA